MSKLVMAQAALLTLTLGFGAVGCGSDGGSVSTCGDLRTTCCDGLTEPTRGECFTLAGEGDDAVCASRSSEFCG